MTTEGQSRQRELAAIDFLLQSYGLQVVCPVCNEKTACTVDCTFDDDYPIDWEYMMSARLVVAQVRAILSGKIGIEK